MATETPNVYRDARRERKAQAVARFLWPRIPREDRTNLKLPGCIAAVEQNARDEFARQAGQLSPSPKCWTRVAELVRERVEDERRWLSLDEAG
jgi:hypothetical protein